MKKEAQLEVIDTLMGRLDSGRNVDAGGQVVNPVTAYTCPDRAAQEWQRMFQDYPQLLGLSGDLPGPGTFFTSTDLGKPVLCTRDEDGGFHAFLNVCRHRGTVVESEARGEKKLFSCPFHAWGYNPRGELVAVPKEDHFGPVDRSCHGLIALPAVEKYGLLWVHPSPGGTLDVDDLLGPELADEFADWDIARYTAQGDTEYQTPMNWKLAIDTFGETYHFNTLHRDSLAQDFHGNVQCYDTYKRNHRMMLCLKNIDALRDVPRDEWNVLAAALPVYYIFPNVQLIIGGAGPTLVRVYPDGANPNQSHSQINFYLDPDIEESIFRSEDQERAYADIQERSTGFAEIIRDEDYVAAASSHMGALSGAQDHVTFGRNEPALHHYHNTYNEALGLEPLRAVSN